MTIDEGRLVAEFAALRDAVDALTAALDRADLVLHPPEPEPEPEPQPEPEPAPAAPEENA